MEKFPQFNINGQNNIWIVKPGQKSRGRGITVHRTYDSIIKTIKESKGRQVVQKYIENPLIIDSRKFDIRQWVLVTDWNPLTIWAYKENYVRLAAKDYDSGSNSINVHLTNNCVVQKFIDKQYGSEDSDEDAEPDYDNIMSSDEFAGYLTSNTKKGGNIYEEVIWPQIKKQIKASAQSV